MFDVTIGPTTTRVECPLIEDMARSVTNIENGIGILIDLLEQVIDPPPGQPRVEFTIGPVREQEE